MIESNFINYIDLGDSLSNIDIYGKPLLENFFNIFKTMLQYKPTNIFLYYFLKFVFFIQILSITIINVPENDIKEDSMMKCLNYIKDFIFLQENINDEDTFYLLLDISYAIIFISILLFVYLLLYKNKKIKNTPIIILNIYSLLLQNYLLCPFLNIFLLNFKCENQQHIFTKKKCFSHISHIINMLVSSLCLLLILFYSTFISLYYYQIGGIKNSVFLIRINCNYELIENFCAIIIYIVGFIFKYYTDENNGNYRTIIRLIIFIICCFILVYTFNKVFYYDKRMNYLIYFGWAYSSWFAFSLEIRKLLKLYDSILFIFIGWVVVGFIIYYIMNYKVDYIISNSDVLNFSSIKELELFTCNLLNYSNENSIDSKIILTGLINNIEEYFKTDIEVFEVYEKFTNNTKLIKKFGGKGNQIFDIYSIIYVIYNYHLTKSELKNDVILIFCYFLMNKLKNITFAISLCSKNKMNGHKYLYLKYLLMEDIKKYLINKLNKNSNKKNLIKHIEIGSVILYNNYIEQLKLKIYDAACNQIDYFDILRNLTTSSKSTKNFLDIGDKILNLRKQILDIWNKMIDINPFNEEIEKDYMLYLQNIIQDEELAEKEDKRYNQIKMSKISEKNNTKYLIFLKDSTTVILVDGYQSNGKIIYALSNFATMFNFTPKEILNIFINDLMPSNVATFHKELIKDALKYSNLNYVYSKEKIIVLKGKNNILYKINTYLKTIPNLSYGLIYIQIITIIKDNQLLIVLDNNFKINSMSDPLSITNGFSFKYTNTLVGHHIGLLIPDIFKQMQYKNQKYILNKNDIDLKGILYPNTSNFYDDENLINAILDKIKDDGELIFDEHITEDEDDNYYFNRDFVTKSSYKSKLNNSFYNNKNISNNLNNINVQSNCEEFNSLINNLNERYKQRTYSIFYHIINKTFLNNKYSYTHVYITQDLMLDNENFISKINKNQILNINETKISSIPNENQILKNENKSLKKEHSDLKVASKGIKLKINEEDEKQILNNNLNEKNKQNNDINDVNDDKNITNPEINKNSYNKSLLDSSSFNKIKQRVIKQNIPKYITYMKILIILQEIVSAILIIFNNLNIKNNFDDIQIYLNENIFFNRSKITTSCIFEATTNFKLIKYNYMKSENNCINFDCNVVFYAILQNCLNNLKINMLNIHYYHDDYKKILGKNSNYIIFAYNLDSTIEIVIDTPSLLNFIMTNGLRLISNLDKYYNENSDSDEESSIVYMENILNQSLSYIKNGNNGLKSEEKNENIQNQFKIVYYYMIINLIINFLLFLLFCFFLYKILKKESHFLEKLIYFHSINFENYIKYLEDLKKKLRNDTGEDDEKNDDENIKSSNNLNQNEDSKINEINEIGNNSKFKKNKTHFDLESSIINKDKKDFSSIIPSNKNSIIKETRKERKKRLNKLSKIKQQKKEKLKIMLQYFIQYNLLFLFKIMIFNIILISYYILVFPFYIKKKNDFLNYDIITDSIEGVFVECNYVYILLKNEIINFINFNSYKQKLIKSLNSKTNSSVIFQNNIYEMSNISDLINLNYSFNLPSREKISINKIGSLLSILFDGVNINKGSYKELYEIFYGDACIKVNRTEYEYDNCLLVWSGILSKGLDQTLTQFEIELYSALDELTKVANNEADIKNLFNYPNSFSILEVFLDYFFLNSFTVVDNLLQVVRKDKINNINLNFKIILIVFQVGNVIFIFICYIVIYYKQKNFISFFNFIGIVPIQYLSEDESFYKDLINIENEMYD